MVFPLTRPDLDTRRCLAITKVEFMKRQIELAIAALLMIAAPVTFACDYPERAQVPDGKTATQEEMIAGQQSVKAYMAAMEDYLACIDATEKDAVAELEDPEKNELQEREKMLAKKHNAAVEEMEIIAAEFNNEVRAYKAQAE